jgi:hypothetical protein
MLLNYLVHPEVNTDQICNYWCQPISQSVTIIRHPSFVLKTKFHTHMNYRRINLYDNFNFIFPKIFKLYPNSYINLCICI